MTGLSRLSATPNDGAVVACLQLSEAVDIADRPVIHNHPWLSVFADNRHDRVNPVMTVVGLRTIVCLRTMGSAKIFTYRSEIWALTLGHMTKHQWSVCPLLH